MEKDKTPESSVTYHNVLSSWDSLPELQGYTDSIMSTYKDDEGSHESCMQTLTELEEQLDGGSYVGEDCVVSGTLYRLDEDDNVLRAWDIEEVRKATLCYDGLQIVLKDGEPLIVFEFSDSNNVIVSEDQAEEGGCTFVATREDLTQLDISEANYEEIIDMQDMLRTHSLAVESLMKTQEYTGAAAAEQAEMLHEHLAEITEQLSTYWGDSSLCVQTDTLYCLDKNTPEPVDWRDIKIAQAHMPDEQRIDIYGTFKGVIVPADHPACERHGMSRNESKSWMSPHAIFDSDVVTMVPLRDITYIEIQN